MANKRRISFQRREGLVLVPGSGVRGRQAIFLRDFGFAAISERIGIDQ